MIFFKNIATLLLLLALFVSVSCGRKINRVVIEGPKPVVIEKEVEVIKEVRVEVEKIVTSLECESEMPTMKPRLAIIGDDTENEESNGDTLCSGYTDRFNEEEYRLQKIEFFETISGSCEGNYEILDHAVIVKNGCHADFDVYFTRK